MHNPNDPSLKSWLPVAADSDFPIQNIPFGVFSYEGKSPRVGTRIGDTVIDLAELSWNLGLDGWEGDDEVFRSGSLNAFISLGKASWTAARQAISTLFSEGNAKLRDNTGLRAKVLHEADAVQMHLPVTVGDYTDFYSSIHHATNVGIMFRGKENALMPNWKHLPVGYHGRASSIVVSGTPLHRPKGQTKPNDDQPPVYGPSRLVDFELETAFVIGQETNLGDAISIEEAENHIFGMVLFNDWSARDIQKWEYVPLGPFLGKNWGSSVSPWIVTMEALEPFRVQGLEQDPAPLEYLKDREDRNFDLNLEVFIQPEGQDPHKVCTSNFKYMYWSMAQQLAHHTVNGCNVKVGDMLASGTISGPEEGSYGSMLEISWRGSKPVAMPDGTERKFINDNDTVIMRGYGERDGVRIGFGEVTGKILPAK